ncbi:NEDD4-binding protein 2 [Pelodytes ibericus]
MPRKRKSLVLSPARKPPTSATGLHLTSSTAVRSLPQTMSNNNEQLLGSLCEMFSNLDPTLIEMVLSEYKEVDVVMDYLLELSNAAKMEAHAASGDKFGFDMIASFLDNGQGNVSPEVLGDVADVPGATEEYQAGFCADSSLPKDLDSLLDEALDQYNFSNSETPNPGVFDNVDFQELFQSTSTENISFPMQHADTDGQTSGDIDIAYQASMFLGIPSDNKPTNESSSCNSEAELTKTSALNELERDFNIKLTMFSENCSTEAPASSSETFKKVEGNDRSSQNVNKCDFRPAFSLAPATSCASLSNVPPKYQRQWNPLASSFYPASKPPNGLLTSVATGLPTWTFAAGPRVAAPVPYFSPCTWNITNFPQNQWRTGNINPKGLPSTGPHSELKSPKKITPFVGKVLILLRGAPGSGKTTLARMLLQKNPAGVILSTDDYFSREGPYHYDPSCLGDAHEWNHGRAKEAFENSVSPIIIDNTNLQGWEMKPYVSMALKHKYKVTFREPDTWWKFKPKELERRNRHGVKKEKISRMLDYYEHVTVNSILNLSRPKVSEKADVDRIATLADRDGQNSKLQVTKKEDVTSTQNIQTNVLDTSISGSFETSFLSENSKKCPETLVAVKKEPVPLKEDSKDCEVEKSSELTSSREAICSSHTVIKCDSQGFLDETITSKDNVSCSDGSSLMLTERPELLHFVGDWPVEKTMNQRTPRYRKKARARKIQRSSVQQLCEEDNIADCDSKQTESDPEKQDSLQGRCTETESIVTVYREIELLKPKNKACTTPETTAEQFSDIGREQKPDSVVVDLLSEVLQRVSEVSKGWQIVDLIPKVKQDDNFTSPVKPDTKPRQTRRNCRHCKLALTFSNCCPDSSDIDKSHSTGPSQIEQITAGSSKSSQTEPHEFALLWRIEKKNENVLAPTKVLIGKIDRFKSKSLDASSSSQENIPYRVMHHKSTSVEEDEISSLGDQDSLNILCKLFRSLSLDVLKDLFERCNKDILWATNLLLDSGERLYIDEECLSEETLRTEEAEPEYVNNCCQSDQTFGQSDHSEKALQDGSDDTELIESSDILMECSDLLKSLIQVVSEEEHNFNASYDQNDIINEPSVEGKSNIDQNSSVDNLPVHLAETAHLETETLMVQDLSFNNEATCGALDSSEKREENSQKLNISDSDVSQHELDIQNKIPLVENFLALDNPQGVTDVLGAVDKTKKGSCESSSKESLRFDHLELSLPPELAHQLSELFGPVGIDPGLLTVEDCMVRIDLSLAKAIHKRWKESITERHRQEALSYQLLFEGSSPNDIFELDNLIHEDELLKFTHTHKSSDLFPFMDQWNTRTHKVSLRQIMSEEIALQEQEDLKRSSPRKDCAGKLKEKQLLEMFPYIEKNLLIDIFKENNYSLEKTEQFMSSVLEADPVQNVVAQNIKQSVTSTSEKTREKKSKLDKEILSERYYQDLDSPDYQDFRAEAVLYRKKQQESYKKAAEAHSRGMKQVAAYYAQQGHLYGEKVKEENQRAAVQIFQRANEFLLPENILDLHGLHVDEAMKHFRKVLQDKMEENKQNGGKSHLSVITGRGNHSQGGIPRIKLAVVDYLTNHNFRFTEIRPGVLRVTLK